MEKEIIINMKSGTRKKYERARDLYLEYLQDKSPDSATFNEFIIHLITQKKFKPSTVWSYRSFLLKYFQLELKLDVTSDISKDYLKMLAKNEEPSKKEHFTFSDIRRYLKRTPNDPENLPKKWHLLIGYYGALRVSEARILSFSDVRETEDGLMITITRSKSDANASKVNILVPKDSNSLADGITIMNLYENLVVCKDNLFYIYQQSKFTKSTWG
jgi:integrase